VRSLLMLSFGDRSNSYRSMHQQQLSGIKAIQDSLSSMSIEHSEVITKTTEAAKLIQTDLEALPSQVSGLVMGELLPTVAKTHSTYSTILTELRTSSSKAGQNSEEIKLAIQSLLSNENTSQIAALLVPALEKAISDRITSSMEVITAQLGSPPPETRTPDRRPDSENGISSSIIPKYPEKQFGVASLNSLSSTTTCIRWAGELQVINFWFGRLILSTSVLDSWKGYGNGEVLQKVGFLETKATFILSKWLLRKGAVLKITRLVSAVVAPSIQFSLTPIMVISEENEIVEAMRYGDLPRVKRLIIGSKVHPSSLFPDGSTLVHRCIRELKLCIDQIYAAGTENGKATTVEVAPEKPQTVLKMIDMVGWLATNGSATGTLNMHRK
jgi:hypothetical protein